MYNSPERGLHNCVFRIFCPIFGILYSRRTHVAHYIKTRYNGVVEVNKHILVQEPIFTGGHTMTEEAKQARRDYANAWKKKNPDKVRAQAERYWERKAEKAREAAGKDS